MAGILASNCQPVIVSLRNAVEAAFLPSSFEVGREVADHASSATGESRN